MPALCWLRQTGLDHCPMRAHEWSRRSQRAASWVSRGRCLHRPFEPGSRAIGCGQAPDVIAKLQRAERVPRLMQALCPWQNLCLDDAFLLCACAVAAMPFGTKCACAPIETFSGVRVGAAAYRVLPCWLSRIPTLLCRKRRLFVRVLCRVWRRTHSSSSQSS